MDTFADTASVYHISFADQGKQISIFFVCRKQIEVCRILFSFAANRQKLSFSVSAGFHLNIFIDIYVYISTSASNEKWKPRQFSLIHLLFAHRANESSLFVCFFTKKQMEVICLQTDETDLIISKEKISKPAPDLTLQ